MPVTLAIGKTGERRRHKRGPKKGRAYRLRRVRGPYDKSGVRLVKQPRGPLIVPLKCGYSYNVVGTGAASLVIAPPGVANSVGFNFMSADWFNRYHPIFDYIRINKVRMEVTCPYNIGQSSIGDRSLYRLWYKRAMATADTVPDDHNEWLNDQRAARKTFSGRTNAVNLYWTPSYETTVQPLNTAVTSLRTLSRQWQTIQDAPAKMTPHIGALCTVFRLDGGPIANTSSFRVNVTMYCELKGLKEL